MPERRRLVVAVVATAVPDGSAAAAAGMLVGDVLVALDGTPITSMPQVQSIIGLHRGGDTLAIDIKRGGEARRLVATLKSFPYESLPSTASSRGSITAGRSKPRPKRAKTIGAAAKRPRIFGT